MEEEKKREEERKKEEERKMEEEEERRAEERKKEEEEKRKEEERRKETERNKEEEEMKIEQGQCKDEELHKQEEDQWLKVEDLGNTEGVENHNEQEDELFADALLGLPLPFGGKFVTKTKAHSPPPKKNQSQDSLSIERQNLTPIITKLEVSKLKTPLSPSTLVQFPEV